jgi:hypothetical protein
MNNDYWIRIPKSELDQYWGIKSKSKVFSKVNNDEWITLIADLINMNQLIIFKYKLIEIDLEY